MGESQEVETARAVTVYKCPHCVWEGERPSWNTSVNSRIDGKYRCPRCERMVRLPDN